MGPSRSDAHTWLLPECWGSLSTMQFPDLPSRIAFEGATCVRGVSDGTRGPYLGNFVRQHSCLGSCPLPHLLPSSGRADSMTSAEAVLTCLLLGEPWSLYSHTALAAEHQVRFVQRMTSKEMKPKEFPLIFLVWFLNRAQHLTAAAAQLRQGSFSSFSAVTMRGKELGAAPACWGPLVTWSPWANYCEAEQKFLKRGL